MFYKFKELLKIEYKDPATYGSILLGATVVHLSSDAVTTVLLLVWFIFLQQLLMAGARKGERRKIQKVEAYRDKVLSEKD